MKTIDEIIKELQKHNYENCLDYFTNKEIIKKIIACDITAFKYVPNSFKDKEMCLYACQCHFSAYLFLPKEFRKDDDILKTVLSQYGGYLKYCPYEIRNNKDYVLLAVSTDAGSIKHSSPRLLNNKEFCKSIAYKYPSVIHHLPILFDDEKTGMFILKFHPEFKYLFNSNIIEKYEKELSGIL